MASITALTSYKRIAFGKGFLLITKQGHQGQGKLYESHFRQLAVCWDIHV